MSGEIPECLGHFEEDERCEFCPEQTRRLCEAVTQNFVRRSIVVDLIDGLLSEIEQQ